MFRRLVTAVLTGAALFSAAASVSADNNLHVPRDYPTIQSAIDAARQGATIVVGPGTYRENLLIQKPLTLRSDRGARDTVIHGGDRGPVVVAFGTGAELVVISGFTITNGLNLNDASSDYAGTAGGIHLRFVTGVVADSVIRDNVGCVGNGISSQSAAVTIERNQIRDNRQDPSCYGTDGGGILLVADGVQPSTVANNVVTGHRIGGSGAGIAVQLLNGVQIRNNIISDNHADAFGGNGGGGILFNGGSGTISGNVLIGNSGIAGGAMSLFPTDNADRLVVTGNVMSGNRAEIAGSAIFLVTVSDESLRLIGNLVNGDTAVALVDCGATFSVPPSNILHNGIGPVFEGNCVSP